MPARLGKDGTLEIRGTSTDDYEITNVTVNGVAAQSVDYNFTEWRATLNGIKPGKLKIAAFAIDKNGNQELTPHTLMVEVLK